MPPNEFKSSGNGRWKERASKSDKIPEADSLKFPNRNGAYVKRHLEFQFRARAEVSKL